MINFFVYKIIYNIIVYTMEHIPFNSKFCHSVKSKNNLNAQCTNNPKKGELFCGKHISNKNIILFKGVVNNIIGFENNTIIDISDKIIDNNTSFDNLLDNMVDKLIKDGPLMIDNNENSNNKKDIYDKSELYHNIMNEIYMNIYSIRNSIKTSQLCKLIETRQSKPNLIRDLKKFIEKERYYIANEKNIVKIQSIIRKWIIYRRKLCNNDTDIMTFTCKYEIPYKYFYIFKDSTISKKYAYDIRTLLQIINSEYQSCPYTFRPYTDEEKKNILDYSNNLIKKGANLEIQKPKLTPDEEVIMRMKDIFHEINMLDNYTNYLWFKSLELYQLIELYIRCEDIWNYRSNMNIESKMKIIKNGIAFKIPVPIIKTFKSKLKLQNILLDEFERFVKDGINREERKLGAILILTGLVEVSYDAACALPHLVQ